MKLKIAFVAVFISAFVIFPSCRYFAGYEAAESDPCWEEKIEARYVKDATVRVKAHESLQIPMQVTLFDGSSVNPFLFVNSDPATFVPFYSDYPYHASGAIPQLIAGSILIQGPHSEAENTRTDYFTLDFQDLDKIDQIHIAFDSRALSKPAWLTNQFTQVPGLEMKSTETYSVLDPNTNTEVQKNVVFTIWVWKRGAIPAQVILGGNNLGTTWQDGSTGTQYLAFVRGKIESVPGVPRNLGVTKVYFCEDGTPGDVDAEIVLTKWVDENPDYKEFKDKGVLELDQSSPWIKSTDKSAYCRILKCSPTSSKSSVQQATLVIPNPSSGNINPNMSYCLVTIGSNGNSSTLPPVAVDGEIAFEFTPEGEIKLGALNAKSAPFTHGDMQFEHISFESVAVGHAVCDDGAPNPEMRLCSEYVLEAEQLTMGAFLKIDESEIRTVFSNERDNQIFVDHNARQFSFVGGPFSTEVVAFLPLIGETVYEITAEISLTFDFENFAPIPNLAEMDTTVPCVDNMRAPVRLDGSASMDFDEAVGDTLSYMWVEDAGSAAETVLGTGSTLLRTFLLGEHNMTLQVEDSRGAITRLNFPLIVEDTGINFVDQTPAIIEPSAGDAGTYISLNPPGVAESCSCQVDISHDGPSNQVFNDGLTELNWRVDDFNGNVVFRHQPVLVITDQYYPPPVAALTVPGTHRLGDPFEIEWLISAQNHEMVGDVYMLIDLPGMQFSVNEEHQLVEGLEPFLRSEKLGANDIQEMMEIGNDLTGIGITGNMRMRLIVVPEGEFPDESRSIVSWATAVTLVQE